MACDFEAAFLQRVPPRAFLDNFKCDFEIIYKYKNVVDSNYTASVIRELIKRDWSYEQNDYAMDLYVYALSHPSHHMSQHFIINNTLLSFKSSNSLVESGTTAKRIWEASLALVGHFIDHPDILHEKNVLELGSGTGFAGISAFTLGAASVTLSDLPEVLEQVTKANINYLNSTALILKALDWTSPCEFVFDLYDTVIGADLVYDPEVVNYLVETLNFIHQQNTRMNFYIMTCVRHEKTFVDFMDKVPFLRATVCEPLQKHFFYSGTFYLIHNK